MVEKRLGHNNFTETLDDEYFERLAFDNEEEIPDEKLRKGGGYDLQDTEAEDILKSIGIYRDQKSSKITEMVPMNRFWLHDTPGAINDAQVPSAHTTHCSVHAYTSQRERRIRACS